MDPTLCNHIKNLKSALLALPATGEKGFEGLIGTTLHKITDVPFRLAGSGSQYGIDGKSANKDDIISFEGKRYDGYIPRDQILSKIASLLIGDNDTDLWILGATSQLRSQLADDVHQLGEKKGIITIILDWSEINLPPLAVALAMGGACVDEFLKANTSNAGIANKAIVALEAIKQSENYSSLATRIRTECSVPTMGLALAQRENSKWIGNAFTNKQQARITLGQPLSPGDTETLAVLQRESLMKKLQSSIFEKKVVFVIGEEGCGKSWLVAQTWLDMTKKPIMVFLLADDFKETVENNDIDELLISKLIKQTDDRSIEISRNRWNRILSQWQRSEATDIPRLVVVIDGINQRPKTDWSRIIEKLSDKLNKIGGYLVVTSRATYFWNRVKRRLSIHHGEIAVAEWAESERNGILLQHNINPVDLHSAVAKSLRNPRILGIALELMNKADITDLEELSVSRLLFEHMRNSERDAPEPQPIHEFAHRLREHAQMILARFEKNLKNDLSVFEGDIMAVADGRFFIEVEGDPTRYTLRNNGLTLALGFSVIDQLRAANRNNQNLDDRLAMILEPISALDDSADVMLAALTVSVIDERCDHCIVASLVKGFASLQNPDQEKFLSFASLVNKQPQSFMNTGYELCLSQSHHPNFDWVQNALVLASRNNQTWQLMTDNVKKWISIYSLSPELGTFKYPNRHPENEVKEERQKNQKKIEDKLKALSSYEKTILGRLYEVTNDFSQLSSLALLLLAGKSLAPFAESLLNWTFSHALNSSHATPYKDFINLVNLNRVDWAQTRTALLKESAPLKEAEVSRTGQWALVNILRATGGSDDDKYAQSLVERLSKDMPHFHFKGGRLVERYCAIDPCDPESKLPENIITTAEQYARIDTGKLLQSRGKTSEDFFFTDACPGVARFKPETAILKYKQLISDILEREGFSLYFGLLNLRRHNALLTINDAHELIKKRDKLKTTDGMSEHDKWILSQYHLLLAFPFLSAEEQVNALLSNESEDKILLNLMCLAKPLHEEIFDSLLEKTCIKNNIHSQHILLAFAHFTSMKLSNNSRDHIASLLLSSSELVRTQAIGVIIQSGDKKLLEQFAKSDWKAIDAESENESWYGSLALLEAAKRELITQTGVVNRISEDCYGQAAIMLAGENNLSNIACRVEQSINYALGLQSDFMLPDIELQVYSSLPSIRSRFRISKQQSEITDIKEVMKSMTESDEAFDQRQKQNYEAFRDFKANLTQAKANIILNDFRLKAFSVLVEAFEDYALRWCGLFMEIKECQLPKVHNIILLLAAALTDKHPQKAKELFCRVQHSKPLVRVTYERIRVPLDSMAVWTCSRNQILDELRFSRLDKIDTDYNISLEVFAALFNNQQELLEEYVNEKLSKEEPSELSKGLMVVGFSDQNQFNDKIIDQYENYAGLIGKAHKAAKYAYERNSWARHWFSLMCETNDNSEFWQYSILFLKIVDGRYDLWRSEYEPQGNPIKLFGLTIDAWIHNRFSRWEYLRKKKLFGSDAPTPVFLNPIEVRI